VSLTFASRSNYFLNPQENLKNTKKETLMAVTVSFPGKQLPNFKELFIPKKEYVSRIRDMDLKERLLDWKPTTRLEEKVKNHIIDNALVKTKTGSKSLRITSYIINSDGSNATAYLSYGGKQLTITKEGREADIGYFLLASEKPEGLSIRLESKREYYKNRTRLSNAFWIILGLIAGAIPGILFIVFLLFIEHKILQNKINKYVVPPLKELFAEGMQ